jgi:hypothetical protein
VQHSRFGTRLNILEPQYLIDFISEFSCCFFVWYVQDQLSHCTVAEQGPPSQPQECLLADLSGDRMGYSKSCTKTQSFGVCSPSLVATSFYRCVADMVSLPVFDFLAVMQTVS